MSLNLIEAIVKKGLSIKESESIIRSGKVLVNNEVVFIPSVKVKESDNIEIKESKKWVSRGAFKLLKAISEFKISFENKNVLDLGSSTGGFTQVALVNGSKKVFAVDVGTNQLDYKLRTNKKVVAMEKTNLKNIEPSDFADAIDIVVCDVSFISLKHVFATLSRFRGSSLQVVALIKPQYEARRGDVQKNGFIPENMHPEIIEKVFEYASNNGFINKQIVASPIKGKTSKNIEYISLFERS